MLDFARRHGLWIIADEIYGRLVYGRERAPSFHDVMAADDKILFVQTLSKNWAMTGWRIGWLEAPPALGAGRSRTSCNTRPPACRCRCSARRRPRSSSGEALHRRADRRACAHCARHHGRGPDRDRPGRAGRAGGRVLPVPAHPRRAPTRAASAFRLIDEAGVGAAPGYAFGPGGEDRLRLCFARDPAIVPRRRGGWRRG